MYRVNITSAMVYCVNEGLKLVAEPLTLLPLVAYLPVRADDIAPAFYRTSPSGYP